MVKKLFTFGKFYGKTRKRFDTDSFVFVDVEDFINRDVPVHTHETSHFCFIVNGEYETTVKDKTLPCSALTMLYHPAGTTHRDHFYTDRGRFLTISLTQKTDRILRNEIELTDHSVDFNDAEISWLGQRIFRELSSVDQLSTIVLEGMANELLAYSIRKSTRNGKQPPWLKQAYELINDRFNEKITVAEIASAVGIHPLHLARTFRRYFGCSPGEYIRKRRIEFASNLLLTSKETLSEIALASGYFDQSQFTHSFKRTLGITPKRFRDLHSG